MSGRTPLDTSVAAHSHVLAPILTAATHLLPWASRLRECLFRRAGRLPRQCLEEPRNARTSVTPISPPPVARALRPRRRGHAGHFPVNQQQVLPLVQTLALPLYWLIGRRLLGLGPVGASFFMLLAPFASHAIVLSLGFVVSYLNQHERQGFRHSRRRDWMIAWLREVGVSIRQFYWLMPFRERFRIGEPVPPLREPPIILVHGYGCNRGLWLPAARWFSRRGYRVSAISLQPLHCSIDDYAEAIATEIERVRTSSGAARVAVVGHSMGGLAARAYLRRCAEQGRDPWLAALITLGTPHRGTHIARIGPGENARQMRFGSAWLKSLSPLEAQAPTAPPRDLVTIRITTICSLQDNIVSRPLEQRLRLPGSRAIVVHRHGHMSLATSVRILQVVDGILVAHLRRARASARPNSLE